MIVDEVLGVLGLCLALVLAVTGIVVLATGRVPERKWFIVGWRGYPPRQAGIGIVGSAVATGILGLSYLVDGRWALALAGISCLALVVILVGWLVQTWRRSNRPE